MSGRRNPLPYIAGAAGASVARKAAGDVYNYAKRSAYNYARRSFGRRSIKPYTQPITSNYAQLKLVNSVKSYGAVKSNDIQPLLATNIHRVDNTVPGTAAILHNRQRDICFLKRCKIEIQMRNLQSDPMVCRWALLQWKHRNATVSPTVQVVTDMFYADSVNTRYINWPNVKGALAKSNHSFNSTKFRVLSQGSFQLAGHQTEVNSTNTPEEPGSLKSWRALTKYVNVNQRLMYDGVDGSTGVNPVVLVAWGTRLNDFDVTASATNELQLHMACTSYFIDTI